MAMTKRPRFELTLKKLSEIFTYDRENGKLFWKIKTSNRIHIGDQVGTPVFLHGNKYLVCGVLGKRYLVHRLIWWMEKGFPPKNQIDHIDGNGLNNKIENLRDITIKEQAKNLCRRRTNTSGVTGVTWNKSMCAWIAQIGEGKNMIYLGHFKDEAFNRAVQARKEAEKQYGFHPNHDRVKSK